MLGAENEAYNDPGASAPEDNQDAPSGSCPEPDPIEATVDSDTSSALSLPVFAHDTDGNWMNSFSKLLQFPADWLSDSAMVPLES